MGHRLLQGSDGENSVPQVPLDRCSEPSGIIAPSRVFALPSCSSVIPFAPLRLAPLKLTPSSLIPLSLAPLKIGRLHFSTPSTTSSRLPSPTSTSHTHSPLTLTPP